jgi:hypothetical protein
MDRFIPRLAKNKRIHPFVLYTFTSSPYNIWEQQISQRRPHPIRVKRMEAKKEFEQQNKESITEEIIYFAHI